MTAHYRILLIEDNPGDARLVREMLRGPGVRFEVETAERLADGVRRLQGGGIDLALLDLGLPDSQGQETLVRVQAEAPEVPVVVMTGTDDVDLALRAVQAGAQDYLVKGQVHEGLLRRSVRYAIERKRAERALRESEEKFRSITSSAQDAIIIVDNDGKIACWNSAAHKILGYSEEEALGQDLHTLLTPARFQEESREGFSRFRNTGEGPLIGKTLALTAVRKGGDEIPIELSLSAVQLGEAWHAIGILRDITEHRRVLEALRASERKYRHFFEQDLAGHYVSTADGRLLACNSAFARLLGFASEQEAMEVGVTALHTSPEARDIFLGRLRTHGRVERFETELCRKDGTPVQVIESASAVRTDDGGDLLEIHGFLIDDTARKEAEREFLQAQKMEAVGRLAGGVAHDFNNVLGVILGSVELLQRSSAAGDPQLKKLGQIRNAAEHAASLTRQLLAFSRRQVLKPRVLDLDELVREVEPMLGRLIGEDIELVTRLRGGQGRVMADEGQIQQVLMNLVVNSRDAMPNGGRLTIEITEERPDSAHLALHPDVAPGPYVVLSVSDTGHGMDAATLAHLFEPFFTTKAAGKGTGLGLATVYGIVKQSGGHVAVESELGKGAAFRVYLPMTERAAEPTPARAASLSVRGGSETILLLEDDAALRSLAHEILERAGYTVLPAAGPEEALGVVSSHSGPIELLISDVIMPGMSGPEFAGQLASLRPQTRVLYMSGYTDEAIARHGVLDAGVRLLLKPFTSEALLREVRAALNASPPVTRPPGVPT